MTEPNPYAPPQVEGPMSVMPVATGGVWRDGNILVMHKQAVLPDRCVKCNAPADGYRLKRSLSWHQPAWFLLILVSLLIYVIVALCIRKTAKIHIGLCDEHRARRRWMIVGAWLMFFASIAAIVVAVANDLPMLALASLVLFLGSLIWAVIISNIVGTKKIDDHYVWLKRVHAEYLSQLPPVQDEEYADDWFKKHENLRQLPPVHR